MCLHELIERRCLFLQNSLSHSGLVVRESTVALVVQASTATERLLTVFVQIPGSIFSGMAYTLLRWHGIWW